MSLADRLVLALTAGDNAGGDKRGRQSSAKRLRNALDTLGWTNPDLETALMQCSGVENLEERMVVGLLDPVVLKYLEERAELATIVDPT